MAIAAQDDERSCTGRDVWHCVSGHRPLPSITLCTICHAPRPMQFLNQLAYQMPRITPNVCPDTSITLHTTCHTSPPMHACLYNMPRITPNAFPCIVPFRPSPCVPYATHHAQCVSVHRPLPSITLWAICPVISPLQFRPSPCVAYATKHPQCVRASPSKIQLVYHTPRITPVAFPCIVPFRASLWEPYATHHAQCNSVHHLAQHMLCITSNVCVRLLSRLNLHQPQCAAVHLTLPIIVV